MWVALVLLAFVFLNLELKDFLLKANYLLLCLVKLRLKVIALNFRSLQVRLDCIRLLSKRRKLHAKCRYWRTLANLQIEGVNEGLQRPLHGLKSSNAITSSKSQMWSDKPASLRRRSLLISATAFPLPTTPTRTKRIAPDPRPAIDNRDRRYFWARYRPPISKRDH
jgi:hypothetical protein